MPAFLEAWNREALNFAPSNEESIDLRQPHRSFRYPEYPLFPKDEKASEYARRLIRHINPSSVTLFPSLDLAVQRWISQLNLPAGAHVGAQLPALPEILALIKSKKLELMTLARDPEELTAQLEKAKPQAIFLSNPHRCDGFYYPDESYSVLLKTIRAQCSAPIMSEESLKLFSYNAEIGPGSATDFIDKMPGINVMSSVYPAMAPHGPEMSWSFGAQGESQSTLSLAMPEEGDCTQATRALMGFQSRQGASVAEFQRKMLVVRRSLRILADKVGPLTRRGFAQIRLWPDTGFYLFIDMRPTLAKAQMSSHQFCLDLWRSKGLLVNPGELFNTTGFVQFCFAASPVVVDDAGTRFGEFVEGLNSLSQ